MKMLSAWFNTYLWAFPGGAPACKSTLLRQTSGTGVVPRALILLLMAFWISNGLADESKASASTAEENKDTKGSSTVSPKDKSTSKDANSGKEKEKETEKEKPKKKKKKEKSTISLHLETNPDPTGRSMEVTVLRSTPMLVTILKEPIVTENHLISAKVVDEIGGGFVLELQFDSTGRLLLENYSASQRGKRLVVFSDFGQRRYIGVKKMTSLISDGKFTFSPDASREEAQRILDGLQRVAKENVKRDKW